MKRRFLILTAGMMVGAVLFLLSICSAGFLNAKPLLISLAGLLLMWGCGVELEVLKTRHHLTTHAAIKKLLHS